MSHFDLSLRGAAIHSRGWGKLAGPWVRTLYAARCDVSQKDLADFLGLKEQQIQRFEAERYSSASLDRLIEVADVSSLRNVQCRLAQRFHHTKPGLRRFGWSRFRSICSVSGMVKIGVAFAGRKGVQQVSDLGP